MNYKISTTKLTGRVISIGFLLKTYFLTDKLLKKKPKYHTEKNVIDIILVSV